MREYKVIQEYEVGDLVWLMSNNKPILRRIKEVVFNGGSISEGNVATSNLFKVSYWLHGIKDRTFSANELCASFEELRDRIFNKKVKETIVNETIKGN